MGWWELGAGMGLGMGRNVFKRCSQSQKESSQQQQQNYFSPGPRETLKKGGGQQEGGGSGEQECKRWKATWYWPGRAGHSKCD